MFSNWKDNLAYLPRKGEAMRRKMDAIGVRSYTPSTNGTTAAIPTFTGLEGFLLWLGAKQMPNTKATSPLEWNGKVVGLTVGLLTCIGALITVTFWAATLSADVTQLKADLTQERLDRKTLTEKRTVELDDMKKRIQSLEVDLKVMKETRRN
jgi:hypothetical protein